MTVKIRNTTPRRHPVQLRYSAAEPVIGPAAGEDSQFDDAVLRGDIVVMSKGTLGRALLAPPHGPKSEGKPPKTIRFCRTKGVTYRRYPAGRTRQGWREIERMFA